MSGLIGNFVILFYALLTTFAQHTAGTPGKAENKSPAIYIHDYAIIADHRHGEIEPLRWLGPTWERILTSIRIQVEVDEYGNVVAADPLARGDDHLYAPLYSTAISEIKGLKYSPFKKDAKAVPAVFTESVRVLPPELPKKHVPFPAIKQWSSLRITLRRTGWPSYFVVIYGDGTVHYLGKAFVVVTGDHWDQISKEAVTEIVEAFRKADYFSLFDHYSYHETDNPTYTTSIAFDGWQKSVADYVGEEIGMPHAVTIAEDTIDRLAGTARWVTGNEETAASLAREHWDFKSQEAGLALVRAACRGQLPSAEAQRQVVRDLIAAGAPPDAHESGRTALQCAASAKDEEMVKLLIQAGAAK